MKKVLVEMLKDKGFEDRPVENEILKDCDGLILQREWSKVIEVLWHGSMIQTFTVRVFVNQKSGICHVAYSKDGREYKSRWYDTVGKRTYNAIVETARCAGYDF